MVMDTQTDTKIEYMEVYVSVKVDITDCKTVSQMYEKSREVAEGMIDTLEPKYMVYDWYEVPRVTIDDCEAQADPVDEGD